jgi:hypothetical protein
MYGPGPLSEDKQVTLVNVYFVLILSVGLDRYIHDFLLKNPNILQGINDFTTKFFQSPSIQSLSISLSDLLKSQNAIAVCLDVVFFTFTYVWVILHWILYHRLKGVYPYQQSISFFLDILFLSVVFFMLSISFSVMALKGMNDNAINNVTINNTSTDDNGALNISTFFLFIFSLFILHIIGSIHFLFFVRIDHMRHTLNFDSKVWRSLRLNRSERLKSFLNKVRNLPDLWLHLVWASIFLVLLLFFFNRYQNNNYYYITIIAFVFIYSIVKFAVNKKMDVELMVIDTATEENEVTNDEYAAHYNNCRFSNTMCYWYHIKVQNKHIQKPAINCIVYLEHFKEITGEYDPVRKVKCWRVVDYKDEKRKYVELKWTAVTTNEVVIEPTKYREFDGLYAIDHGQKGYTVYVGINQNIVDNEDVRKSYQIERQGDYMLQFVLYSLNLEAVSRIFILHVSNNVSFQDRLVKGIEFHSNNKENIQKCKKCRWPYYLKNVRDLKLIPKDKQFVGK